VTTPENNTFTVGPTEITANEEEPMPTGDITVSPKKSKKGLLAIIIILILVLVGGGVAYMLWNNSDSKIIQDAWHNLFKEKNQVSLNIKADVKTAYGARTAVTLAIDGASKDQNGKFNISISTNADGTSFTAKADVITTDDDIYIKTDIGQLSTLLGGVAQYDGQWIRISKSFVEQLGDSLNVSTDVDDLQICVTNAINKLKSNVANQDELFTILANSQVLKYQRVSQEDNLITYNLDMNYSEADSRALIENLKTTVIYNDLAKCSGDISDNAEDIFDTDDLSSLTKPAVTFTVNSETREFYGLGITINSDDGSTVTLSLTGSTSRQDNINVTAPEEAVDISEVLTALYKLMPDKLDGSDDDSIFYDGYDIWDDDGFYDDSEAFHNIEANTGT
jgi:hypothetical protein